MQPTVLAPEIITYTTRFDCIRPSIVRVVASRASVDLMQLRGIGGVLTRAFECAKTILCAPKSCVAVGIGAFVVALRRL
jgi:hypothetical protein